MRYFHLKCDAEIKQNFRHHYRLRLYLSILWDNIITHNLFLEHRFAYTIHIGGKDDISSKLYLTRFPF